MRSCFRSHESSERKGAACSVGRANSHIGDERSPLEVRLENNASRVAILTARLGPYHIARYKRLGALLKQRLLIVEVAARDREYAWEYAEDRPFACVTAINGPDYEMVSGRKRSQAVVRVLERFAPDVVTISGYSPPESRAALNWCELNGRASIVMSDSQRGDAPRLWWREWVKRQILKHVDAGFVAGQTSADYLHDLGIDKDRVLPGLDAVDNDYFRTGAARAREQAGDLRRKLGMPQRFFLCSARYIAQKNLSGLMRAYKRYQDVASEPWSLVLLGDGPLRPELEALRAELGLSQQVQFTGFKQYNDLPAYYGLASALVLPSVCETWGLVVNEGMAAGLPAIVSRACGSAELVENGINGYVFSPGKEEELAARLGDTAAHAPSDLVRMGTAASDASERVGLNVFAKNFVHLIETARHYRQRRRRNILDPVLWM
jgi:1,2-diacylglycerol 3-alpha-glucosyltransferase